MKEILHSFNSFFQFSSITTQAIDNNTLIVNLKNSSEFIKISLNKESTHSDKMSGTVRYFYRHCEKEQEAFENLDLMEILFLSSRMTRKRLKEEERSLNDRLEFLDELDEFLRKTSKEEEPDKKLVAFSEIGKIEKLRANNRDIRKNLNQFQGLYNKELENFEIAKMFLDLISRFDTSGSYMNNLISDYSFINVEALKIFFMKESNKFRLTKNISNTLGEFTSELAWKDITSSMGKKNRKLIRKLGILKSSQIHLLENIERASILELTSEIPLDKRRQIEISSIDAYRYRGRLREENYKVFKSLIQASEIGIIFAEKESKAYTIIEKYKKIIEDYEKNNPDVLS